MTAEAAVSRWWRTDRSPVSGAATQIVLLDGAIPMIRAKRATRADRRRAPRAKRRRTKLAVDLAALDRVVGGLRERGFIREAEQLDEALHGTAYPNTTDMLLEIAVALRASYRRARYSDAALERDFRRAARELRKARSDYEL